MAADDFQSKAAELMKKALTVGVGAVFMTEETIRNMAAEFKLPKELISGILESAGRTKNEFFQKLSSDVIDRIKDKIDPQSLVEEMLARNEIELHIKMSFKPKKKD